MERVVSAGAGVVREALPRGESGGALSRCDSGHLPFEWTLNPYRGCEFGCKYCYARYTHGYLGLEDPLDFERKVFVKEDLPRALARDLDRRVLPGHRIAVGTATDPYQPAERVHGVTRACLEVAARRRGLRLSITTRSDLVLRDLDLLRVIAARSSLHVSLSVTTLDRALAGALEPKAASPMRRLQALRALRAEGIEAGVFLMPVLPGLTDGPGRTDETGRVLEKGALEAVIDAAADAGAAYLVHQVVFLREPARSFWTDYLRREHPGLVVRYARWFARGASADPDLREAVARRVARARRRRRLASAPRDTGPPDPQLTLFDVTSAKGSDPSRLQTLGSDARTLKTTVCKRLRSDPLVPLHPR